MDYRSITVNINIDVVVKINTMFGIDVSTMEGSENFFNLAMITLLVMGEELKKDNVIVSMNPRDVNKVNGKIFKFPNPDPRLRRVK